MSSRISSRTAHPSLRLAATVERNRVEFAKWVTDTDPFIVNGAINGISWCYLEDYSPDSKREIKIANLLVRKRDYPTGKSKWYGNGIKKVEGKIVWTYIVRPFLADPDETVRFLAAKWIADEKLADYRDDVVKAMKDPALNVRMYMAYATALARLDGQEVNERSLADYFAKRLADDATPPEQRVMLLRQVPATHPKLTVDLLGKLLAQNDDALKLEAVRALAEHPNPKRSGPLFEVLRNPKLGVPLRAFAMLGLADRAQEFADEFVGIARNNESPLQLDALRALIGVKLKDGAIGNRVEPNRPAAKELDAWMKRLEGPADAEVGARVFFHPKLGGCYKCHRVDGRGKDVGPDLSTIGQTDRRHLLESILQPSNNVAPHYQVWHLETADGKIRNGMLLDTNLDNYTYLDANGGTFKVNTRDVVETRPVAISIMPDGLADRMTDQEVRDLLAYLQARK